MPTLHFSKFVGKMTAQSYSIGSVYISRRASSDGESRRDEIRFVECFTRNARRFIIEIPEKYTMRTGKEKIRHLYIEPLKDLPVMADRVAELMDTLGSKMGLIMISPTLICTSTAGFKIGTTATDIIETELGVAPAREEDEIDAIEREIEVEQQIVVTPDMLEDVEIVRPKATPPDIVFEEIEAELRDLMPLGAVRKNPSDEKHPPEPAKEGPTDASAPMRFERGEDGMYELGNLYIVVDLLTVFRSIDTFHQQIDNFISELERREEELRDEKTSRVHETIHSLENAFTSKTSALREAERTHTAQYLRLTALLTKATERGHAIAADKIRRLLVETQHHLLNAREAYRDILANYTEGLKLLM